MRGEMSCAISYELTLTQVGIAVGLWGSRYFMEEEGGYELIPDMPYPRRA